jgi:choline monooxygenase
MSDLSNSLEALARSRTQLPVSTYFDAELHRRELELIFQPGPRYIGHELAVPEVGQHHTGRL